MPKYELIARVDTDADEDGSFLVRSPAVGVADGVPPEGAYLNPLAGFLTLSVLHRRHLVRLPRNVQGRVTERLIEDTLTPVGFDQPLFRLSQVAEASGEAAGGAGTVGHASAGATATDPASTDLIAITAPSEGVFYRRPSPDAPPYVEAGAEVTTGTVLGLVEVMKSFNQITYGGTGLPERGTVIEVLVDDTAEVAFGQRLFLIRPA